MAQDLESLGYSGRAVAHKLIDQINFIRLRAITSVASRAFSGVWENAEIETEIPGVGVSIASLFRQIKKVVGLEPTRITGAVVRDEEQIHVTVRISGETSETINGELNSLDKILLKASEHVYRVIQPYILAAYQYQFDKQASLDTVKLIISKEPATDDPPAFILWGLILADQGDHEGAITKYKEAIELDPTYALSYNNWGVALANQGDYEGAIAKYEKAIQLDPTNALPYSNWGLNLAHQTDNEGAIITKYEKAITKYKRAIELDPTNALSYINWGAALANQGDYEGAIAKYKTAIKLDPDEVGSKAQSLINQLRR